MTWKHEPSRPELKKCLDDMARYAIHLEGRLAAIGSLCRGVRWRIWKWPTAIRGVRALAGLPGALDEVPGVRTGDKPKTISPESP